jgi:hypothetical protein
MFTQNTLEKRFTAAVLLTVIALTASIWSSAMAAAPTFSASATFDYPHGEWGRYTIFNAKVNPSSTTIDSFPGSAGNSYFSNHLYYGDYNYYNGSQIFQSSFSARKAIQETKSDVYWSWGEGPVGTSTLLRYPDRLKAELTTTELAPGQAMTFWFIVFNYPELCSDGECGFDDLGNTPAKGDFLWADGRIINKNGKGNFSGQVRVDDLSSSGMLEMMDVMCPETRDCAFGLMEPETALVILAVHSHGPILKGQELVSQLKTYFGGCEVVTGTIPGGFSAGVSELPVNPGECATIQVAPHAP